MKSPGHEKHPEHKVTEKHLEQRVKVEVGGQVLADSYDVLAVDEDGCPRRYYFPRSDVRMDVLARAETTSHCPFKGTANYYDLRFDGRAVDGAVWTYEAPYEEHAALQGRVAFWEEEIPEVERVISLSGNLACAGYNSGSCDHLRVVVVARRKKRACRVDPAGAPSSPDRRDEP